MYIIFLSCDWPFVIRYKVLIVYIRHCKSLGHAPTLGVWLLRTWRNLNFYMGAFSFLPFFFRLYILFRIYFWCYIKNWTVWTHFGCLISPLIDISVFEMLPSSFLSIIQSQHTKRYFLWVDFQEFLLLISPSFQLSKYGHILDSSLIDKI